MFFEDEKDFIENGADIHISEDGTVTWEDVLSDDGDDIISSSSKSTNNMKEAASIELGDDLELIQDDEDVEAENAELDKILNGGAGQQDKLQDDIDNNNPDDEFDIDGQLADVVSEQNNSNDSLNINPRKNEIKQSKSILPLLIAALFAVFVVGLVAGGKYLFEFLQSKKVDGAELAMPLTTQDEMNNITQEELEKRKEEKDIPVVNEDEVNEVKPEEQEPEEKKEVVDIIPSGRDNPFLPIAKYVSVSIPHATIDFEKVNMPKPPEKFAQQDENAVKLLTIAVSGIMYDDERPSAIITYDNNDYFVQKGDRLDDYRVIEIAKNYVTIALGKNTYRANIGEEFKISSNFYGSAQYLDSNQGGGRQYHSVGDENASQSSSSNSSVRYVSEEEVIINAR